MNRAAQYEVAAEMRGQILALEVKLRRLISELCPGPHNPVQHRDHRRPWCEACFRTADGTLAIRDAAMQSDPPKVPPDRKEE